MFEHYDFASDPCQAVFDGQEVQEAATAAPLAAEPMAIEAKMSADEFVDQCLNM